MSQADIFTFRIDGKSAHLIGYPQYNGGIEVVQRAIKGRLSWCPQTPSAFLALTRQRPGFAATKSNSNDVSTVVSHTHGSQDSNPGSQYWTWT